MAATVGAPQQQMMMGAGGDIFNNASKVMVKQEFALLECFGCEAKNRYRVSIPNGEEEGQNIFLYINEESGCLERICCSTNRSLTLEVHQGATKDGPVVQAMHKPFHLQGCCFCRPNFTVFEGPQGGKEIGKVEDPEARKSKLAAELANGRLAMVSIIGMFFQDGLTGSAWGDWALYTASPLRAKVARNFFGGDSSPAYKSFDPATELGVQDPLGFWDPLGFCEDEAKFKDLRAKELKQTLARRCSG